MISINLEKARNIAHSVRRQLRDEEMKPFDDIVAKQIPGNSAQAAESKRQTVRQKYAVGQQQLDSCSSVQELEEVLNKLNSWKLT